MVIKIQGLINNVDQGSDRIKNPKQENECKDEGEDFESLGVRFKNPSPVDVTEGFSVDGKSTANPVVVHGDHLTGCGDDDHCSLPIIIIH